MTKYVLSLQELSDRLAKLDEGSYNNWISDFLIRGYTAPLASVSPDQPRSSLVAELYAIGDYPSRARTAESVALLYKRIPPQDLPTRGFRELLDTIVRLNITSLFPDLWRLAYHGSMKDRMVEDVGLEADIHNYVLRTVFGLTFERELIPSLLLLIRRDIHHPRYMLECFTALCGIVGHVDEATKIIPEMLSQLTNRSRDYEGAIRRFLSSLPPSAVAGVLVKIIGRISNDYVLVDRFQEILLKSQIEIYGRHRDGVSSKSWLRIASSDVPLNSRQVKQLEVLYRRQIRRASVFFTGQMKLNRLKEMMLQLFSQAALSWSNYNDSRKIAEG